MGLEPVLQAWCKKHECPLPDITGGSGWTDELPAGVYFRDKISVRQIHGLALQKKLNPEQQVRRRYFRIDLPDAAAR